jgi:Mrp family chromosome partitioning ATPase
MDDSLTDLPTRFDVVIVDTPPLLPVIDGAVVAAAADGALLVVRHGGTTKARVATALASSEGADARLLGCVLNMVPRKGVDAYGHRDAYHSEADPNTAAAKSVPAQPALSRTVPADACSTGGFAMAHRAENIR